MSHRSRRTPRACRQAHACQPMRHPGLAGSARPSTSISQLNLRRELRGQPRVTALMPLHAQPARPAPRRHRPGALVEQRQLSIEDLARNLRQRSSQVVEQVLPGLLRHQAKQIAGLCAVVRLAALVEAPSAAGSLATAGGWCRHGRAARRGTRTGAPAAPCRGCSPGRARLAGLKASCSSSSSGSSRGFAVQLRTRPRFVGGPRQADSAASIVSCAAQEFGRNQ